MTHTTACSRNGPGSTEHFGLSFPIALRWLYSCAILLPALVASCMPHHSFAQVPEGFSAWSNAGKCDAGCKALGRGVLSTHVWILRKGALLCGLAEQDYGLEVSNKTPAGRLAGQIEIGKPITIQFNDSFSDPSTLGAAVVNMKNGHLTFDIIENPPRGYLALNEGALERQRNAQRPLRSEHYKACAELKADMSGYLSVLP